MKTIERLTELEKAANRGPWRIADDKEFPWIIQDPYEDKPTRTIVGSGGYGVVSFPREMDDSHSRNWDLMVAARNALPALLAVVEAAYEYVDRGSGRDDLIAALRALEGGE